MQNEKKRNIRRDPAREEARDLDFPFEKPICVNAISEATSVRFLHFKSTVHASAIINLGNEELLLGCLKLIANVFKRRSSAYYPCYEMRNNDWKTSIPPIVVKKTCSLLSSTADSWISPSVLSSRSNTALRELMAENHATVLSLHLILDRDWHLNHHGEAHSGSDIQQHLLFPEPPQGWDKFQETGAKLILNLTQDSSSAYEMLSVRGKTEEEDDECWEL
ncbi:hypothetical protein V6N12_059474 [Hibiscus sabdariffa]|uniref:Uncharacterized protein n=1 Tax=Hibiscus sabdariffa TaxID=183260 RepID=A0ABR2EV78_9ROSI